MPPKKKSNKKADDWEAELGETVDPIAAAAATAAGKEEEAVTEAENHVNGDADSSGTGGGGGLLAALKKNKTRKAKKGKPVQEDFVEGEDPTTAEDDTKQEPVGQAPEEADADDVFGTEPIKEKGKSGKGAKQQNVPAKQAAEDNGEEDEGDGGAGIKSKKEKEREKKEREKQRKKEQVGCFRFRRVQLLMGYRQQRRRQLHRRRHKRRK